MAPCPAAEEGRVREVSRTLEGMTSRSQVVQIAVVQGIVGISLEKLTVAKEPTTCLVGKHEMLACFSKSERPDGAHDRSVWYIRVRIGRPSW